MPYRISDYKAEVFSCYSGRSLEFLCPANVAGHRPPVAMELARVEANALVAERMGVGPDKLYKRVPFSLLFRVCGAGPLGHGLFQLQHPDFEPEEWYLAPVLVQGQDPGPNCMWYEAVFT
jgi:hypothetical protein